MASERRVMEDRAKRIIKSFPNIEGLREYAEAMHELNKRLWIEVKGAEGSKEHKEVMRYGFTKKSLEEIRDYERGILKDYIKLQNLCNCNGDYRRGDTQIILPDETKHQTYCERAKEFIRKYHELLERYK